MASCLIFDLRAWVGRSCLVPKLALGAKTLTQPIVAIFETPVSGSSHFLTGLIRSPGLSSSQSIVLTRGLAAVVRSKEDFKQWYAPSVTTFPGRRSPRIIASSSLGCPRPGSYATRRKTLPWPQIVRYVVEGVTPRMPLRLINSLHHQTFDHRLPRTRGVRTGEFAKIADRVSLTVACATAEVADSLAWQ